eukprot:UN32933
MNHNVRNNNVNHNVRRTTSPNNNLRRTTSPREMVNFSNMPKSVAKPILKTLSTHNQNTVTPKKVNDIWKGLQETPVRLPPALDTNNIHDAKDSPEVKPSIVPKSPPRPSVPLYQPKSMKPIVSTTNNEIRPRVPMYQPTSPEILKNETARSPSRESLDDWGPSCSQDKGVHLDNYTDPYDKKEDTQPEHPDWIVHRSGSNGELYYKRSPRANNIKPKSRSRSPDNINNTQDDTEIEKKKQEIQAKVKKSPLMKYVFPSESLDDGHDLFNSPKMKAVHQPNIELEPLLTRAVEVPSSHSSERYTQRNEYDNKTQANRRPRSRSSSRTRAEHEEKRQEYMKYNYNENPKIVSPQRNGARHGAGTGAGAGAGSMPGNMGRRNNDMRSPLHRVQPNTFTQNRAPPPRRSTKKRQTIYIAQRRTLVRKEREKTSERVTQLDKGTIMRLSGVRKGRAYIIYPVCGWVSLETDKGALVTPLPMEMEKPCIIIFNVPKLTREDILEDHLKVRYKWSIRSFRIIPSEFNSTDITFAY